MDDYGLVLTVTLACGAAGFLALGVLSAFQGPGSLLVRRLATQAGDDESDNVGSTPSQVLRDHRMSRFETLNPLLRNNPLAQAISIELVQARVPLKVGEYLLLRAFCAVAAAFVLMSLGGSWLASVPGALMGYFAPKVYVGYRRARRISTLETQLVEALALSANSLRAGWGFMQAMQQVASDMPPPISEEFTQVFQEVSIGATPEAAIQNLLYRVPSYDLELVMTAVLIQRQIGGNLAEMMDNIAFTIRERTRLLGDIASITAESNMSMWLLSLLPVGMLILLAVIQADYMLPFLTDPRGRILLVGAAVMETAGVFAMRRLANVQV
ncbi:MAG: type II secretion system F family protein [Chloroflexi bacterium]|nr:type II secretion system F family protein [Chloroflexota bacterium]